jgi:hypothetical protein
MVAAECDGLTQRIQEDLAVRTDPEMRPDLVTNVAGQFIIEIGRELLQNLETVSLAVLVDRLAGTGMGRNS